MVISLVPELDRPSDFVGKARRRRTVRTSPLARRESLVAAPSSAARSDRFSPLRPVEGDGRIPIARSSSSSSNGFGEELDGTGLHGLHRDERMASVPGDEHDRRRLPFRQLFLQLESVDVRQLEEWRATRQDCRIRFLGVEKRGRRGERRPRRVRPRRGGWTAPHVHARRHRRRTRPDVPPYSDGDIPGHMGKVTVKMMPKPVLRPADRLPPSAATIDRQIVSPSPVPPASS